MICTERVHAEKAYDYYRKPLYGLKLLFQSVVPKIYKKELVIIKLMVNFAHMTLK